MKKVIFGMLLMSASSSYAGYSVCTAKCSFKNTPVDNLASWVVDPPQTYELGDVTVNYRNQESYSDLKNRLKDACQEEIIKEKLHVIPSIKSSWIVYSSIEDGKKILGSQSDICK